MALWMGLPPGRGYTLEHINNSYTYLLRLSLGSLLPTPSRTSGLLGSGSGSGSGFLALTLAMAVAL